MSNAGVASGRDRRRGLALMLALLVVPGAVDGAHAATVTEFPNLGESALDIAAGPDGNMWFTMDETGRVGRITPAGTVTTFSVGRNSFTRDPTDIAAGPDGNMWFTESEGDRIGRITPAGKVTEFSAGISADSGPSGIAAGPDGNVWFTEFEGGRIGRITPSGKVTEFSAGITPDSAPGSIAAGPDGNMWFTEFVGPRVGRITPAGKVTEFSAGITDLGSFEFGRPEIAAGPDGNLWFTSKTRVGRITPTGKVTEFSAGISPRSGLSGIAAGPDGNVWFTEFEGGRIGRITPAGKVTEFSAGITPDSLPGSIAAGPDGNLWFTQFEGIGRITTTTGSAVAIRTRRARVSTRGLTTVKLACGAGSRRCAGKVVLTIPNPRYEFPFNFQQTITLARARFSLPAGQHATIKLRLSRSARRRLARAKHRRLSTRAQAITRAGDARRKLTLTAPRRQPRR